MKITRLPPAIEQRNKRVAAYARVSTLFEEQEESYETQCAYYRQLIENTPGWDLVDIYADHGKSGLTADKRPDFLRMIDDCYKGLIDIILVKSISRFGRNASEVQEYVHKLREINVEVQFDREGLKSSDLSTELVFNFMTAIAQEESRSISENVKISLKWRAERGERHIGSNRVYGYDEIDGVLTPNDKAKYVKLIFEEFAAGIYPEEIVKQLQKLGAKRLYKTDEFLNISNVRTILRNEIYMGDRLIQKFPPVDYITKKRQKNVAYDSYYVENAHEAIVSRETWNKVQERIAAEKKEREEKNIYRTGNTHFMYGKIFCGECGEPFNRKTFYYHGTMQRMWKCRDRIKGSKGNGCKCRVMSEEDLFHLICFQTGIKWTGVENVDEKTFSKIKRVDVFTDRHIEITYEV